MDEVHDVGGLQVSVDTAASSPQKRRLGGALNRSSGDEEEEDDDDEESKSNSSSDDDDFGLRKGVPEEEFRTESHGGPDSSLDEDSDEPPEIPGSPIAQKLQLGLDSGGFSARSVDPSSPTDSGGSRRCSSVNFDDDEYEHKEAEQPRAAEFYASSTSEDEDELGSDDEHRNRFQLQMEKVVLTRPKTAAKDLEKYRDAVPNDFFQHFEGDSVAVETSVSSSGFIDDSAYRPDHSSMNSPQVLTIEHDNDTVRNTQQQQYQVNVPRDVEELFNLVDVYTPEDFEIETQLEPFLPEFIPSVGLPFDGIQIPRPDGKDTNLGVEVLREPSGQKNVAELELLLQVSMTSQNKLRSRHEVVRSIEQAAHRPQEIDQWIASVEKVQRSKPMTHVNYKRPMPPIARLIEFWPEAFEDFLASRGEAIPALSELDASLKELVQLVCVLLDIPVYEGSYTQSLHVLLSLYLEIKAYERDAQGSQR